MQEPKLVSYNKVALYGKFKETVTHKITKLHSDTTVYNVGEYFTFHDYDDVEHRALLLNIIKIGDFNYELVTRKYSIDRDIVLSMLFPNRQSVKYSTHILDVSVAEDALHIITFNNNELDSYMLSNKYFKEYFTLKNKSIYSFHIPVRFSSDVQLLIQGRYSFLSTRLKTLAMRYCSGIGNISYLGSKIVLISSVSKKVQEELLYMVRVFNRSAALKELIEKEYNVKLNKNSELHNINKELCLLKTEY